MNFLDLFSGIGGFSLGLERAGMKTIAFCEIEKYPREILNKHWPDIPKARDIRKLSYNYKTKQLYYKSRVIYVGTIQLICGGFPCQPFSVAGKQRGKEDNRHLWPEMFRLIKEIRPNWVIGENVAGFIAMALDDVLFDLESESYTTQSFVIPACAVGGIHRRDRVWIIANSSSERLSIRRQGRKQKSNKESKARVVNESERYGGSRVNTNTKKRGIRKSPIAAEIGRQKSKPRKKIKSDNVANPKHNGAFAAEKPGSERTAVFNNKERQNETSEPQRVCSSSDVADTNNQRSQRKQITGSHEGIRKRSHDKQFAGQSGTQRFRPIESPTQPPVRHRDDGLPDNVARLKALGNAVIPQIPELIGRAIMEIENETNKN